MKYKILGSLFVLAVIWLMLELTDDPTPPTTSIQNTVQPVKKPAGRAVE